MEDSAESLGQWRMEALPICLPGRLDVWRCQAWASSITPAVPTSFGPDGGSGRRRPLSLLATEEFPEASLSWSGTGHPSQDQALAEGQGGLGGSDQPITPGV